MKSELEKLNYEINSKSHHSFLQEHQGGEQLPRLAPFSFGRAFSLNDFSAFKLRSIFNKRKNSLSFTLIELLVVIAIISILAGILFPALSMARKKSLSTKCVNNLRGIGTAMQSYMSEYNEYLPEVAQMPSLGLNDLPRFCDVFDSYLQTKKIFLCPSDPDYKFFASEGCSYEFNTHLGGRKLSESHIVKELGISKTFLMFDYDNFHGKPGKPGARNYLFADGHIGDLND